MRFNWAPCDRMLQSHAFQVLHGNKACALAFADFVDRADVGMVECGSRACFSAETLERGRVLRNIVGEKFKRDKSSERQVLGLVDNAHPAAAEFFDDAVVRNDLTDHWAEILGLEEVQVNEAGEVSGVSA